MTTADRQRRLDPANYLPREIFDMILEFVTYPTVLSLTSVSRDWRNYVTEFVETNPCAYTHLDFRQYDLDLVTPEVLLRCIQKSRGMTTSVLYACHSTKNAHYGTLRAMIFLHNTLSERSYIRLKTLMLRRQLQRLAETGDLPMPSVIGTSYQSALVASQAGNLSFLTGLAIDNLYFVIRQWNESGINDTSALYRLEELHISAHALPMLFAFIRTKRKDPLLPQLRILRCTEDYEARSRLGVPHWLDGEALAPDLVAFPELQEFSIGGIPMGREREQDLDQDCLDIVPQWMPKLKILQCRGVNIRPCRYPRRREYVHRIDMRQAKHIVELDLSYTKAWIMPFVNPNCRRLILRGAGIGAVDLSNSMLNGTDDLPNAAVAGLRLGSEIHIGLGLGPRPIASLSSVQEQYQGLEMLDLSNLGAVLTNNALLGILGLCNPRRLHTLVLQSCLRLEFGKYWSELMERVVQACPGLRCLKVSKNRSVSDGDLVALAELEWLEHVDVSGTSVSDRGLRMLSRMGRRVRIVVADTCPDVSARGLARLRTQGISTRGDGVDGHAGDYEDTGICAVEGADGDDVVVGVARTVEGCSWENGRPRAAAGADPRH
ncbi:uncharacterized protein V1518DRAFT_46940 [Limtongia smithiae]|uniref:uncharacterized protein n=1 Tax=Limtongia smithiae TaxID=1125753 RepID=UPI0034CD74AB